MAKTDIIPYQVAATITGLFIERCRRTPDAIAYHQYNPLKGVWFSLTWVAMESKVAQYQTALKAEKLAAGDRVAVDLPNCIEWVCFKIAAVGLRLVVVPLHINDRIENVRYILQDTEAKIILIQGMLQCKKLLPIFATLHDITTIVTVAKCTTKEDPRVVSLNDWIGESLNDVECSCKREDLAAIMYTSGATGRPKGVELTHDNMILNISGVINAVAVYQDDHFLSFLPLSHIFELTIGFLLPIMAGAKVSFARSVEALLDDLKSQEPTIIISVPRVFERIYDKITVELDTKPKFVQKIFALTTRIGWDLFLYKQGRAKFSFQFLIYPLLRLGVSTPVREKFGGKLRVAVCGGAALSPIIAERFISLGIPIINGYGLTETSPVVSCNTLDDNEPMSVGRTIPGVKVKISENDELLVKTRCLMRAYHNQPEATDKVIEDEWFHTGDKAETLAGRIYIIGRIKEVIVMSNGNKISPNEMEIAINTDSLFEHVMVVGEGRSKLIALVVVNPVAYDKLCAQINIKADKESYHHSKVMTGIMVRIGVKLKSFSGEAVIRGVHLISEAWSVENGRLTPTMKLRRDDILMHYDQEIEALYERL